MNRIDDLEMYIRTQESYISMEERAIEKAKEKIEIFKSNIGRWQEEIDYMKLKKTQENDQLFNF